MDVETKRDVQGYIIGQYKAFEKMGHEHITPTGTRTIFVLGQARQDKEFDILDKDMKADLRVYVNEDEDADRPWRGVRDFTRKIATCETWALIVLKNSKKGLDTETPHQTRLMRAHSAPSLAQCIANASFDSAGSGADSDAEEDDIGLELNIENALSSFAKKVEGLEDEAGALSITPSGRAYSDASSSTPSPPKDIDISYPYGPKQNSRLRRPSGNRSLASLIAHAEDSRTPSRSSLSASLSSCPLPTGATYSVVHKPYYDPDFEGHSPCATHDERGHIKDADEIPYANQSEATARICPSSSKGTLNSTSSVWSSVFSKCSSMTSISSYRTSRPQSARTEHPRLMSARGVDNHTEKCGRGYEESATKVCSPSVAGIVPKSEHFQGCACGTVRGEKDAFSLPVTTTKEWSSGLQIREDDSWPNAPERIGSDLEDAHNSIKRNESKDRDVEELSQLRASLTIATENHEHMRPEVSANRPHNAPLMYEEADDFVENIATNSDVDSECWSESLDGCTEPRRKWTSKIKHCPQKIPQKTKQATQDYVKATKRFSRTACHLLPAALSSRHPFQKIDSII
ncbi:hypothetical protein BKA58DRAFT_396862 [Alternaria rosae]|uniref:uncharacterized protein n=1 Tax=Alternaria rosae TaxID=1187941 RepID=UPI001E8D680A|nr:uncharacterized protein BKA58DRAFT_396862 [Alternaria rosae]KAH6882586.1 hypothetical protein BKA58DRAFT_396862 [Alternaria rosae]